MSLNQIHLRYLQRQTVHRRVNHLTDSMENVKMSVENKSGEISDIFLEKYLKNSS